MITEKFDRSKLAEGRNFGFGFAFLNKIEEGNFETLNAFTACKDYLNDLVYVENTNKPLDKVYGFEHTYKGNIINNDYFYLGVRALNSKGSNIPHPLFNSIEQTLTNNYENLVKFLNKLEEKFDFPKTEFEHLEEGVLVLKVSTCWARAGFLISLYTLYIRVYSNITEEKLHNSLEDIILGDHECIIKEDSFMVIDIKDWIKKEIFEELLNYEYPESPSKYTIHNFGISGRINQIKDTAKAA